MSRYTSLFITMMVVFWVAALGVIAVEPVSVFAQEEVTAGPDLSGFNIYFSESNAELSQFDRSEDGVSRYASILQHLGANLGVLEWRQDIPADADLIVIPGPSAGLPHYIIARLSEYIQRGGSVLILADPFDDRGRFSTRGLEGFSELAWFDYDFRARPDVIVREGEPHQIDVVERDADGEVTFEFSGEVPTLATDFLTQSVNLDHPVTDGLIPLLALDKDGGPSNLNSLYFNGSQSLEIDAFLQNTAVPLVFTGETDLYGETNFTRYQENGYADYNAEEDSERGNLILAVAYGTADDNMRLVLIGDVDIVRNGAGFSVSPSYSGSPVYPVNVQFMIRTAAWLLGAEPNNLAAMPTPAATATATVTPTPMSVETATPTPEPTETPAEG